MDNSWDLHHLRKIIEAQGNMIRLQARVAGMQAENVYRQQCGHTVAYDEASFHRAIAEENAGVNDIAQLLYHS
jgi:hypothetical protein